MKSVRVNAIAVMVVCALVCSGSSDAQDAAMSMPDIASTDITRAAPKSFKDYGLAGLDEMVTLDALVPWEV